MKAFPSLITILQTASTCPRPSYAPYISASIVHRLNQYFLQLKLILQEFISMIDPSLAEDDTTEVTMVELLAIVHGPVKLDIEVDFYFNFYMKIRRTFLDNEDVMRLIEAELDSINTLMNNPSAMS